MSSDIVRVKVERYNPDRRESFFQTYEVPRGTKSRVLDFLNYIFEEIDPSLGYRRHLCNAKMCNACYMSIDGKARLVCWEIVSRERSEIVVSPLKGKPVLRDLIVDFGGDETSEE